jgi:hypothetical protein
MTSPRFLGVSAIVAAVTLLGVACGDDGMGASGLSGGSQSAGATTSASSGTGFSSSGEVVTDPTTGAPGTTEPETTNDPNTTQPGTTIPDPTTGAPDTTTNDPTNETTNETTNDPTNGVTCGNGAIDGNEQCDGANLNGFTCEALGNVGGTLQCDPVTCTFDTQLCEGGGGTSG